MKVALSMRVTEASNYSERRDSISHDWIVCLDGWGAVPVLLPNLVGDLGAYISSVAPDLIVLTGGDDIGSTPERDRAETNLLKLAIARRIPVIGVCRGMQLINGYLGGTTVPVAGHVACSHDVSISPDWQQYYGERISVNSYHNQGIAAGTLGDSLDIAATDPDGAVEGIRHKDLPVAGIMWHPERAGAPSGDRALFDSLARQEAC